MFELIAMNPFTSTFRTLFELVVMNLFTFRTPFKLIAMNPFTFRTLFKLIAMKLVYLQNII